MGEVHEIKVGEDTLYEVIENDDGISATIREAEDHSHQVTFLKSMAPVLASILNNLG